jgi:hypothetical protein
VPVLAAGGIATGVAGRRRRWRWARRARGWARPGWRRDGERGRSARCCWPSWSPAGSEDTVITRAHSGKPCRVVRSAWSDAWAAPGAPEPLPMPYQQALTGELLAAIEEHDVAPLVYEAAGQGVAWLEREESVADIIGRLLGQAQAAWQELNNTGGETT